MARRDDLTMELPGVVRRRGRPATGKAKSGAERTRKWRAGKTYAKDAEFASHVTKKAD